MWLLEPLRGHFVAINRGEKKTMEGAKKIQQMMEFEMSNCKKNISFYEDQMKKNVRNKGFYAEQIVLMQKKLKNLQVNFSSSSGLNIISEKLQGFL